MCLGSLRLDMTLGGSVELWRMPRGVSAPLWNTSFSKRSQIRSLQAGVAPVPVKGPVLSRRRGLLGWTLMFMRLAEDRARTGAALGPEPWGPDALFPFVPRGAPRVLTLSSEVGQCRSHPWFLIRSWAVHPAG